MAHIVSNPADTQTIAAGPADIRAEISKVANDQVANAGLLNGLASGNGAGQIPVSNGVKNTGLNAELHGGNLPSAYATAGHGHAVVTGSSDGFMSNTDKTKLDGIAAVAEVNQNAFSNVLVGATTIQADSKTDTLEFVAGANIALTPDATNDRITIAAIGVETPTGAQTKIDAVIANLIASAPGALDTLNELAAAMGDDPNFAATMTNALALKAPLANPVFTGTPKIGVNNIATTNQIPTSLPASGGNSDSVDGQHFAWSNRNNNPSYLWGVDNNGDSYLAARASMSVYYASNAGNADTVDGYHAGSFMIDSGHSFAANGYQKLSNGLILQWGEVSVAANTIAYVTLPISYPGVHLQAIASNSTDLGWDYSQSGGAVAPYGVSQIAVMNIENNTRLLRWFSIGY